MNLTQRAQRAQSLAPPLGELASEARLRGFQPFNPMEPDDSERRSRDTRPQPAWRHPATPCKAAQSSAPALPECVPVVSAIVFWKYRTTHPATA